MPGTCSVPGCDGYREAKSRGVVFHCLPRKDPERCALWLRLMKNPKYGENTPVSKYKCIRICSQHFKPEDYETDMRAEIMKSEPRKVLKDGAVPSVFPLDESDQTEPALKKRRAKLQKAAGTSAQALRSAAGANSFHTASASFHEVISAEPSHLFILKKPSTSSQEALVWIHGAGIHTAPPSSSLALPSGSRSQSSSSQWIPPVDVDESSCSVSPSSHLDETDESFAPDAEFISVSTTAESDDGTDQDQSQRKTIVYDSSLMELFKVCQTCGQAITEKQLSQSGAQKKVKWSCCGGHSGTWMSSPYLCETLPEINLATAASIVFTGGTFTQFEEWAKVLNLHFIGPRTLLDLHKPQRSHREAAQD